MDDGTSNAQPANYAITVANESYDWYRMAAIRSRRNHRRSAIALLVIAAAIPVAAVVEPRNAVVPAFLGAAIVVLTGVRSVFDWQENYIRFSGTREAVEAERRLYHTRAAPYDDEQARDRLLVAKISAIEQEEMSVWFRIVEDQPRGGATA